MDDLEKAFASGTPVPMPAQPAGGPSALEQEFAKGRVPGTEPSIGDVAKQAVPKGIANLLNTPVTIANLIMSGIANLEGIVPYAGHLKEAGMIPNLPMQLGEQGGLINPSIQPQTGLQRIVDATIQVAVGSALIPGAGGIGTLKAVATGALKGASVGALSGAAGQATKELTGSDLLAVAVGMGTPFAVKAVTDPSKRILLTPTGKMTLKEAQQYGFQVEPSAVRTPLDIRESVAGKAAIPQEASRNNQAIANTMTEQYLSLPEGTPLSRPLLKELREGKPAQVYREVAGLSDDAAVALEEMKQARADAHALYRSYINSETPNPALLTESKRLMKSADSWQNILEDIAMRAGRPELIPQLKGARQYIARTYDVEDVLNVGSGNVSMRKIGKLVDADVPVGKEFQVIGKFAETFKRSVQEVEGMPPVGVSATDVTVGAVLGGQGAQAAGPAGLMAAGLPLLRQPARAKVLSPGYQSKLLQEPGPPTPIGTAAGRAAVTGAVLEEENP